jgi:hypothetical protein
MGWWTVPVRQHVEARGLLRELLIDAAKLKNVEHLPPSYAITVADLQDALIKQGLTIPLGR